MDDFSKQLKSIGIIPVVKINNENNAVPLAKALIDGGLPAIEITLRSNAAIAAIKKIADSNLPIFICAGTVLTEEQAKSAIDAGASAVISPGTNMAVVEYCKKNGVPVIPGCATPTEVEAGIRAGLSLLKFFPAEAAGGTAMLKALSGPYADIEFMPTGGINLQNAKDYLSLKNVIACGGSWIASENAIDSGEFDKITAAAAEAAAIVKQ